eukprot:g7436.t1
MLLSRELAALLLVLLRGSTTNNRQELQNATTSKRLLRERDERACELSEQDAGRNKKGDPYSKHQNREKHPSLELLPNLLLPMIKFYVDHDEGGLISRRPQGWRLVEEARNQVAYHVHKLVRNLQEAQQLSAASSCREEEADVRLAEAEAAITSFAQRATRLNCAGFSRILPAGVARDAHQSVRGLAMGRIWAGAVIKLLTEGMPTTSVFSFHQLLSTGCWGQTWGFLFEELRRAGFLGEWDFFEDWLEKILYVVADKKPARGRLLLKEWLTHQKDLYKRLLERRRPIGNGLECAICAEKCFDQVQIGGAYIRNTPAGKTMVSVLKVVDDSARGPGPSRFFHDHGQTDECGGRGSFLRNIHKDKCHLECAEKWLPSIPPGVSSDAVADKNVVEDEEQEDYETCVVFPQQSDARRSYIFSRRLMAVLHWEETGLRDADTRLVPRKKEWWKKEREKLGGRDFLERLKSGDASRRPEGWKMAWRARALVLRGVLLIHFRWRV